MHFDAALGAGTVVGPLVSEMTFDKFGWVGSSLLLAGLCLSGVVPVVSPLIPVYLYLAFAHPSQMMNIKPRRIAEVS